MSKEINLGDFVWVYGDYEELYEVKGYFEELSLQKLNPEYELCLILNNKRNFQTIEVSSKDIILIQDKPNLMNRLLDKYNDYMLLEQMFKDGEYGLKARQLWISDSYR
jgi:hypothetical protein